MTELSGTLDGVGLPAIVRFLAGLKKTGCLRVSHGDWQGEVYFDAGRVTGARLGSRSGLSALDALVQALPSGNFAFAAAERAAGGPTIHMAPQVFDAHLDELASRSSTAVPKLPPVDAVPALVAEPDESNGEEPLALDRGTLQTLLAVDGQRSVRDIVAHRGSFDALWQLRNLVEFGLLRLETRAAAAAPSEPRVHEPGIVRPFPVPDQSPPAASHCPKLGFEDDPSNSFGRPTRLHRCFAAGTAQPLSLDQQRELCLSDHFATCPRLTMAAMAPTAEAEIARGASGDPRIVRLSSAGRATGAARNGNRTATAEPSVTRRPAVNHDASAPRSTPLRARIERQAPAESDTAVAEPLLTEPPSRPAPDRHARLVEPKAAAWTRFRRPFLLRLRGVRLSSIGAAIAAVLVLAVSGYLLTPKLGQLFADDAIDASRLPNSSAIAAGTPVAQVTSTRQAPGARSSGQAAAVGNPAGSGVQTVVTAGQPVNPAGSAAQAGVGGNRSSAAGQPTGGSNPVGPGAQPAASARLNGAGTSAASAAASAAAARVQPTLAPTPAAQPASAPPSAAQSASAPASAAQSAGGPALAAQPAAVTASAAQPAAVTASSDPAAVRASADQAGGQAPAAQPAGQAPAAPPAAVASAPARTLLDEDFAASALNWPNDPQGTAWLTSGSYQLATRQAGKFVAISAPVAQTPNDVVVSATFRKVSGPIGGGYGIIVRDQGPLPQEGTRQDGRYYVLEVGDKGEVGIWRRESDHWVDVLPWQHSDVVKSDTGTNELTVRAIGNTLSLLVNGTQITTRTDDALTFGSVGLFVGGDGNQVAVEHFSVQTP
jgi:uncharacterized protein DUF4388